MEKIISTPDLESIKTYLHSFLSTHERITASDVYNNIKVKLTNQYDENVFKAQLSKAIKDGRLGNLTTLRGPHGGIRFASKSVAPIVEKPAPKEVVEDVTAESEETDNEENYQEIARQLASKPYFTTPSIVPKPQPAPVIRHTLMLNGKQYEVPHTINEIKTLITMVFEAPEDENGILEFSGVKYKCTEEQAVFLDKFLFFFYGAAIVL